MVIVRLNGGLGNQLFQYAVGRTLAYRRNVPLKFDTAALVADPIRDFRLGHFRISAQKASPQEVGRVTNDNPTLFGAIRRRVEARLPYYRRRVVEEQRYHQFDPNIFRVPRTVYLRGYWQCEEYFRDIEDVIRDDVRVRHPIDRANQQLSKRIVESNSVSLHVRRGDYVSNPKTYRGHGVCSIPYYERALRRICRNTDRPTVFVFSDDIPWAEEHLHLPCPVEFVRCNGAEKDYLDLHLMRQCKHHIIANSTFSWWGAWLCDYQAKTVVAPLRWFNQKDRDTSDLIPSSWVRL